MNTGFAFAQEHNPPEGAHLFVLAGVVIAALVVLGVRWWRTRHGGSNRNGAASSDRPTERASPREEE
jgi:hypothetical protein